MKKKTAPTARPKATGLAPLIAEVRKLIQSARHAAASTVNTLQVLTNFEIGRRIVEHEQKGEKRAGYGQELLTTLSVQLTKEFGKGFSARNLRSFRSFFQAYQGRLPKIWQKPSAKLIVGEKSRESSGVLVGEAIQQQPAVTSATPKIGQTATDQFTKCLQSAGETPIPQTPSGELAPIQMFQQPSGKACNPFSLSWSHYVQLLTIKDPDERSFYEIEAAQESWSLPELKRQVASCLFERLALSRDKAGVKRLAAKGQIVVRPEDVLKEPLVLEFLGLDEKASYSESDLEAALINHLEQFLLELGKGFLFEARQKRFTFDGDHYFLDLVFYNRLLRCYVLVDLKLAKLTHQDLGQMQMYVNYYDRHAKLPEENPTIGLLLCKEKKDAVVELTLPKGANIHAKEYRLYLPSKALLRQKLLDWTRDAEGQA